MPYRFLVSLTAISAFGLTAFAQGVQLVCEATADPRQIRLEGVTEPLGEIVIRCSGVPGATVSGSLTLGVSAPVTNRVDDNGRIDAMLIAETASGQIDVGGRPLLLGRNNIAFNAYNFAVPANGLTSFRIANILVDPGLRTEQVRVTFTTSGLTGLGIRNNPVVAGVPLPGLLTNGSAARIVCTGSPFPDDANFAGFFNAGTRYATLRVTEGSPVAFEARRPGATHGVRIRVKLTGFPRQARVFVPDRIAGSSAAGQTSAGDLGIPPSGGFYQPGGLGGSLLFTRVQGANEDGTGGFPLAGFSSGGIVPLTTVSEIPLFSGTGYVFYEVFDSNPSIYESAHLPLWIFLPSNSGADGTVASAEVSFAPLAGSAAGSGTAIPRFRLTEPGDDCAITRDCDASYFPKLFVDAPALSATVPNVRGFYQKFIRVLNDHGGLMFWTARISFRDGSGWARIFPEAGVNNASLNMSFFPENLQPGVYRATLAIDAGPRVGSRTFPIELTVREAMPGEGQPPPVDPGNPPTGPKPRYWTTGNAADLGVPSVVPGSLARIQGTRLAGSEVAVTFDGIAATVIRSAEDELTVLAPAGLTPGRSARLVVTVDGAAGDAVEVPVAAAAPAIFHGAVYNADGSQNSAARPESIAAGVLQIFVTGLPGADLGTISARIHDRIVTELVYAGPAPSAPGVQQVNLRVPPDLPPMTTEVRVCGAPHAAPSQMTCSNPAAAVIQ
ncbi:MAG: hypothetical protein R2729_21510 [Bryobacteraceae bacterium]